MTSRLTLKSIGKVLGRFWGRGQSPEKTGKQTVAEDEAGLPGNLYVVSSGGTGSKLLLRALYPGVAPDRLRPLHLHTRTPEQFIGQDKRFLYLFGDPRNSVVSFFQRRESRHTRHGFEPPTKPERRFEPWVQVHMDHIEADASLVSPDWDIKAFLKETKGDPFGFKDHMDRWMDVSDDLDVAFVRYEDLWSIADVVRERFSYDPDAPFPEHRRRRASWGNQPPGVAKRLDARYGKLAGRWEAYPPLFKTVGRRPRSLLPGPQIVPLRSGGMYSVVNGILAALEAFESGEIGPFKIDSSEFLYGDWTDYYQPPFDAEVSDPRRLWNYPVISTITPRKRTAIAKAGEDYNRPDNFTGQILLPPSDRHFGHRLIQKYLHLSADLKDQIDQELAQTNIQNDLAVHVRGPGRLHGGVALMRDQMGYDDVPYGAYFEHIDTYLTEQDCRVFLFTDAEVVLRAFEDRYGTRIAHREASHLEELGEPHLQDGGPSMNKLGRDIIIEAHLMANTRFLLHGNSNVTNHVLCLNPDLAHLDIYQEFYG